MGICFQFSAVAALYASLCLCGTVLWEIQNSGIARCQGSHAEKSVNTVKWYCIWAVPVYIATTLQTLGVTNLFHVYQLDL